VLSALGGLIADIKNDFVKTTYYELDEATLALLADDAKGLEAQARTWMAHQIGHSEGVSISLTADMRYRGQSFEIEVPIDAAVLQGRSVAPIRAAFHREHERLYGHSDDEAGIQVVTLRLVIAHATPKPELERIEASHAAPVAVREIDVWMDDAVRRIPLYRRADLRAGQTFDGPAVVSQDDATTCVLPGFTVNVDPFGNLVLANGAIQS
jgi:N-methylhydantoinase A